MPKRIHLILNEFNIKTIPKKHEIMELPRLRRRFLYKSIGIVTLRGYLSRVYKF